MRQSLRYASWLLLLFILLSCSHRVTGEATALPPILQAEAQSQKYNLQLDFMKHHFSGMLIVRQMPDNEIRILGSTYFGLSLFDFSLHCDTFIVNSCMEPMRFFAVSLRISSSVFHLVPHIIFRIIFQITVCTLDFLQIIVVRMFSGRHPVDRFGDGVPLSDRSFICDGC